MRDTTEEHGDEGPAVAAGPSPAHSRMAWIKANRARAINQLNAVRPRLEALRPRSRTIDSAFIAVARDTETGAGGEDAALRP